MSLFSISAVTSQVASLQAETPIKHGVSKVKEVEYINSAVADLGPIFGELQMGTLVNFSTDGQWSLHKLLQYLLAVTGPAHVCIATWSLTEEPVRALLKLHSKGLLLSMQGLFDHRIVAKSPEAFFLARSFFDRIGFGKSHAKLITIRNDSWSIAVVGSSNFTRNPRLEAGVLLPFVDSEVFFRQLILTYIDKNPHV